MFWEREKECICSQQKLVSSNEEKKMSISVILRYFPPFRKISMRAVVEATAILLFTSLPIQTGGRESRKWDFRIICYHQTNCIRMICTFRGRKLPGSTQWAPFLTSSSVLYRYSRTNTKLSQLVGSLKLQRLSATAPILSIDLRASTGCQNKR